MIGSWELVILLPVFLVGVVATMFWIWMLIDCVTKENNEGNNRLIWVLIIIFAHWIGALIYLIVRRPQRVAETGQ
jgi:hypothetical protein